MWDLLKQRFNLQKNTLIQILQKHCLIYKSFGPTIYKIEHYYVHELVYKKAPMCGKHQNS